MIQNGVVVNNTGIEANGTLGNEVIEEVVDKKPTPTELLQQVKKHFPQQHFVLQCCAVCVGFDC